MATAQKFDTLDGLVVTGTLETGGITSSGGLTLSGNLAVDTNTLFVNASTNGVAIGNTNTYGKLYISHTGANPSLSTASAQNAALTVHGSTSTIMSLGAMAASPYVNYIQVTALGQNTPYPLTLQPADGNVGIGTSTLSPDYRLTVNGGGAKGISIWDAGSSSDALRIVTNSSSSYINTITHGDTGLEFNNNSTSRGYNWSVNGVSAVEIASTRVTTFRSNVVIDGHNLDMNLGYIDDVNYMVLADAVYHDGDTNTYMQFHAADQWRVVTGGAERLEVNNSQVTINNVPLVANGQDITGKVLHATDYFEETVYNGGSGTSYVMNINNGSVHKFQPTGNYSIDFSNFPTSGAATFTLIINNNGTGREPTWPSSGEGDKIYWAEGVEPPHSSGTDIYTFYVVDGQIYGGLGLRNAGFAN
jgi:hypothetical protein